MAVTADAPVDRLVHRDGRETKVGAHCSDWRTRFERVYPSGSRLELSALEQALDLEVVSPQKVGANTIILSEAVVFHVVRVD